MPYPSSDRFKLNIFGVLIFVGLPWQAVAALFQLPIYFAIYPYLAMGFLIGMGMLFSRREAYPISSQFLTIVLTLLPVGIVFLHQVLGNGERIFYVIYSFRFYYGVIFAYFAYLVAFRSYAIEGGKLKAWIGRFVEVVILTNFALSIAEILMPKLGLGLAPWAPMARVETDLNALFGRLGVYRTYGFTANSAVLGGFTVFLLTYYVGQNLKQLKRWNWVIITLATLTVFMSQSGTGFYAFIVSLLGITYVAIRSKKFLIPAVCVIISVVALVMFSQSQFDYQGRFKLSFLSTLWHDHGKYMYYYVTEKIDGNVMNFLFGTENLQKLTLSGKHMGIVEGGASLYDFAYLAMLIEVGLVGVLAYVWFYFRVTIFAFGKDEFLCRYSIFILLFCSIHYGVSFWVCSQLMAGLILAGHTLARGSEKGGKFWGYGLRRE